MVAAASGGERRPSYYSRGDARVMAETVSKSANGICWLRRGEWRCAQFGRCRRRRRRRQRRRRRRQWRRHAATMMKRARERK